MITEKYFWKCIYTWVKYLDYQVIHQNTDDSEIWLVNEKSHQLSFINMERILLKKYDSIKVESKIIKQILLHFRLYTK